LMELRVNSGLSNRMRTMSSALALSRAVGQPLAGSRQPCNLFLRSDRMDQLLAQGVDPADEAEKTLSGIMEGGHGRVVGEHIHRGDNDASIQVSPLEVFLQRRRREVSDDPEVRCFLATDAPDTERAEMGEVALEIVMTPA
jgi:hypothetical protein